MFEQALTDLMTLLPIAGPPSKEKQVSQWIQEQLLAMGVQPAHIGEDEAQHQSEYGGDCGNLIVQIPGRKDGPRLMFSTHMDTVPDAVGCRPRLDRAQARIVNDAEGKALGGDNRLGCAALLTLARTLMPLAGDHLPITLVFFVQEEVGLVGARGLDLTRLSNPLPTLCFNLDGGRVDEFVTAVTGTQRFTIDITGISAHAGGRPADGVSAAVIAARAIARLDEAGWHGRIEKAEGVGSANVGIMNGGQGSNVVMPHMHILAEARSHDPGFRRLIVDTWREAFLQAAAEVHNQHGERGNVTFGPGPTYEAFALADDEPTVVRALAAAQRCGITAKLVSNDGGMDANHIVAHGIPAVTIGAGQRRVHGPEEWIDLADFEAVCNLISHIALAHD